MSQLECALGSLGQSLAHVKISGRSPPKGENTVSRKMRTTHEILHVFGPQIFLGESPPIFWSGIIKFSHIPTM